MPPTSLNESPCRTCSNFLQYEKCLNRRKCPLIVEYKDLALAAGDQPRSGIDPSDGIGYKFIFE